TGVWLSAADAVARAREQPAQASRAVLTIARPRAPEVRDHADHDQHNDQEEDAAPPAARPLVCAGIDIGNRLRFPVRITQDEQADHGCHSGVDRHSDERWNHDLAIQLAKPAALTSP